MTDLPVRITPRQKEILEYLDKRLPIKLIAAELSISETRVNQHIRNLKRNTGAHDLSALIHWHRTHIADGADAPYRKPEYRKKELPNAASFEQSKGRDNGSDFVLSDAQTIPVVAPWDASTTAANAPEELNGRSLVVRRIAVMFAFAAGIAATIVLIVTAAVTIGNLLNGKAKILPDKQTPATEQREMENANVEPGEQ